MIDFTITDVKITDVWEDRASQRSGFSFFWATESAGFGYLTFIRTGDEILCDNECMSREFIKTVFDFFVDRVELRYKI